MYRAVTSLMALVGLMVFPGTAFGQDQQSVTQEIREVIRSSYAYTAENLEDKTGGTSAEGSVEFWSSGGLANTVPADAAPRTYEFFNLVPKYIWVISVTDDVAVAQYYVEGSYQEVGAPPVSHYFTRATEVYVKEGGAWKVRAAHWSPVKGGTGTQQTAIGS